MLKGHSGIIAFTFIAISLALGASMETENTVMQIVIGYIEVGGTSYTLNVQALLQIVMGLSGAALSIVTVFLKINTRHSLTIFNK